MTANAERLCEVGKIREAENFFQFCKTVVVRWATVGRTEGERSEPFVQRFAATRSWRLRSTKLSATTKLDTKHKTSFNH